MLIRIIQFQFLLFCYLSHSQTNVSVDSLAILIEESGSDSDRVDSLNKFSYFLRNNNFFYAEKWANEALRIADDLGYKVRKSYALTTLALLKKKQGCVAEAEDFFKQVISIRKEAEDVKAIARAYCNLANLYRERGRTDDAEKTYQKGQALLDDYPASKEMIDLLQSRAALHKDKGQFEKALEFLLRSETLAIDYGNDLLLANTLLNLGNVYLKLDNWQKVEAAYKESLNLFKKNKDWEGVGKSLLNLGAYHNDYEEYKKAVSYFLEALKHENNLSKLDLANIHNNLGVAYHGLGKKSDLEKSYQKALELYKEIDNQRMQVLTGNNLGEYYFDEKDFKAALNYLLIADSLSQTRDNPVTKCNLYKNIYKTYDVLENDDLAYEYLQKHSELREALNGNYLNAVTMERNLEEAENRIAQLEIKELEQEKENQLLMSSGTILILFLLAGIAAFIAYRNRQKQKIAEYKVEQANQEIDDLLIEQELITANAKMAGTEETQKRIAKDLHDGISVLLATIKLYFGDIDNHLREIKSEFLHKHQKANELLNKADKEVRRISHDMVSEVLEKFGLVEELKDLIVALNTSNKIQAKFYANGMKEKFSVEWEGQVYKIIQELIGNVLKHANAEKITVQLNRIDGELNILVEDNGIGFDPEKAIEKKGIGLRNITTRIADLNGRFHIDSAAGHGTTVSIDLPIPLKENITHN